MTMTTKETASAGLREALAKIANGDGYYGAQAREYKEIARAALQFVRPFFDYCDSAPNASDCLSAIDAALSHQPGERCAIDEIAAERRRQIEAEGWTPEHDDQHDDGELAIASACYATAASWPDKSRASDGLLSGKPPFWPWDACWWKPTSRRRDLIKAGALIVAEIERLDRAAQKGERSASNIARTDAEPTGGTDTGREVE